MYSPLLSIAIAAILCVGLGLAPRWAGVGRAIAPMGTGVALGLALWREGLEGGRIVGREVGWPQPLSWLGGPIFRTDAFSAGLGAWCLLLGTLCLFKMATDEESHWRLAVSALIVGMLYSVVHTDSLLAFAGQLFGIVLLVWAYGAGDAEEKEDLNANAPYPGRGLFALGVGALILLGAVMLLGRTMGGDYSIVGMSVSALTVGPLVLLTGFSIAWLGMLPLTGWSGEGRKGAQSALMQSLVLGVPVVTLILRLEALLSAQTLAGTLPGEWRGFTIALCWLGGLTALVSAAGLLLWAGRERWTALFTAHAMGLTLWGLGLDTPQGRYAAVAILLAYGAGRVTLELSRGIGRNPQRSIGWASLAAAPLTVGFVGVWLLGAALTETGLPTLAIALAGVVILAASGVALNVALTTMSNAKPGRWTEYVGWIGIATACLLVLGGTLPGLWLLLVKSVVSVAGGNPGLNRDWTGLLSDDGQGAPVLLMLLGVVVLVALGWMIRALTKSKVRSSGTLLPPALERMGQTREVSNTLTDNSDDPFKPLLMNPPAIVWWVSLAWLDAGIAGSGSLLGRLGRRSGRLLGRLEGRFYLPLALILALLLVLAVTR